MRGIQKRSSIVMINSCPKIYVQPLILPDPIWIYAMTCFILNKFAPTTG